MTNKLFLLLGGNSGNILQNFALARNEIAKEIGRLICASPIYKTEPWGFQTKDFFLNQVLHVKTKLEPGKILYIIRNVENSLGRKRAIEKYSSRSIDIDVLFYSDTIVDSPELIIPHPRLHLRRFTLVPLSNIAADFIHPVLKKSVFQLLKECEDTLEVKPIDQINLEGQALVCE